MFAKQKEQNSTPSDSVDLSRLFLSGRTADSVRVLLTLAALAPIIAGADQPAAAANNVTDPCQTDSTSLVFMSPHASEIQSASANSITLSDGTTFTFSDSAMVQAASTAESAIQVRDNSAVQVTAQSPETAPAAVPSAAMRIATWAARGGTLALGWAAATGAIRGSIKAFHYLHGRLKDFFKFSGRECMQSPSSNFHMLTEQNGLLKLDICSIDKPELDDIFRNGYADRVFKKALALCTLEQPFPSLNLDAAGRRLPESRIGRALGKHQASPILMFEEITKLLRDAYSALYREGIVATGMRLPAHKDTHVLIPICEVIPGEGRDLIFAAISASDFELFGNATETARIDTSDSRAARRVEQLKKAYLAQQNFREKFGQDLFPLISVCVKA